MDYYNGQDWGSVRENSNYPFEWVVQNIFNNEITLIEE